MKEIGCFPQVKTFKVYGTIREHGKTSKIPKGVTIPEPILYSKARPSTYLTAVASTVRFMSIKNYFIDFISNYNIGEFQKWKLKVHHRNKVLNDYSLFHLSYTKEQEYVDYKSSKFFIRRIKDRNHRGKSIHVKNRDNYLNIYQILYDDGYWLKCDELVFNLSNATEDLFRLTNIPFGNGHFVSERLKAAIEKERFTGMAFKEIEENNKKIKVIY